MNDRISIIVPVYNISQYLERSIESIISQTYKNLEIITVDDGSVDGSLELLKKLSVADSRIRVIHQNNGGVTSARLTGVSVAKGDWIGFVDGDDYVEPDMFERLLRNAKQYNADISHCGYQMVFPSRVDYYYNTGRVIHQDKKTGLKDLLEGKFIEPALVNKLYNRRLFQNTSLGEIMDFSIKNTEDLLMNYYLFRDANSSVYEDYCPYHYIVRKESAANKPLNEHQLSDPLSVLKRIKQDSCSDMAFQRIINKRITCCLIGLSIMKMGEHKSLIKRYRSQARKELRGMIPELIHNNYDKKIQAMAVMTSYCPDLYRLIYKIYSRISGTDKKYEVK